MMGVPPWHGAQLLNTGIKDGIQDFNRRENTQLSLQNVPTPEFLNTASSFKDSQNQTTISARVVKSDDIHTFITDEFWAVKDCMHAL